MYCYVYLTRKAETNILRKKNNAENYALSNGVCFSTEI